MMKFLVIFCFLSFFLSFFFLGGGGGGMGRNGCHKSMFVGFMHLSVLNTSLHVTGGV